MKVMKPTRLSQITFSDRGCLLCHTSKTPKTFLLRVLKPYLLRRYASNTTSSIFVWVSGDVIYLSRGCKLKPRTDEQFFLDKFSLTILICSYVRGKIDKFSLTRSLVLKLVMTAFKPGELFVFGRVYNRPGKIERDMRSTPMSTYCKILFITFFLNSFIYLKFIAQSIVM